MSGFRGVVAALVLCGSLLVTSTASAELTWSEWENETFGVEFELPDSMELIENNEEGLLAVGKNSGFVFGLFHWEDASATSEEVLTELVEAMFSDIDITAVDSFEEHAFGETAAGWVLLAKGKLEGEKVRVGVGAVVDEATGRSFIFFTIYKGAANDDVEGRIIGSLRMK